MKVSPRVLEDSKLLQKFIDENNILIVVNVFVWNWTSSFPIPMPESTPILFRLYF
jgi:hypothetical protein